MTKNDMFLLCEKQSIDDTKKSEYLKWMQREEWKGIDNAKSL